MIINFFEYLSSISSKFPKKILVPPPRQLWVLPSHVSPAPRERLECGIAQHGEMLRPGNQQKRGNESNLCEIGGIGSLAGF